MSGFLSSSGGGGGTTYPTTQIYADTMDSPTVADWALNSTSALATDSNNASVTVRLFDDSTDEGAGFLLDVPTGATNMIISMVSRAETANAGNVIPGLYSREIPDNVDVPSWSSETVMTALAMTSDERWQYDTQTIALSALSITAGFVYQFEFIRDANHASDNLTGDWALLEIKIDWS